MFIYLYMKHMSALYYFWKYCRADMCSTYIQIYVHVLYIYIWIYIYVHLYVYMYICIYIYTYTHSQPHTHTHTHTHTYIYIYIYMYIISRFKSDSAWASCARASALSAAHSAWKEKRKKKVNPKRKRHTGDRDSPNSGARTSKREHTRWGHEPPTVSYCANNSLGEPSGVRGTLRLVEKRKRRQGQMRKRKSLWEGKGWREGLDIMRSETSTSHCRSPGGPAPI